MNPPVRTLMGKNERLSNCFIQNCLHLSNRVPDCLFHQPPPGNAFYCIFRLGISHEVIQNFTRNKVLKYGIIRLHSGREHPFLSQALKMPASYPLDTQCPDQWKEDRVSHLTIVEDRQITKLSAEQAKSRRCGPSVYATVFASRSTKAKMWGGCSCPP